MQCRAALTRLMPSIGGPREAKRRLVASVVYWKLLYAASIWTSALDNHAILKKLCSAQIGVVPKIVSAYRTVSMSAVQVLASVPLIIDLLAEESKETFQFCMELTGLNNLQEIARAKETIRKDGTPAHSQRVCTRSASIKETMSRVATADPFWTMQSTHSLPAPGGVCQERLSVGQ